MGRFFAGLVALVAILTSCGAPAFAEPTCMERADLSSRLATRFSEVPSAAGLDNLDRFLEIYVSPAGTWTMVITTADGSSCVIAYGTDWFLAAPKPGARA